MHLGVSFKQSVFDRRFGPRLYISFRELFVLPMYLCNVDGYYALHALALSVHKFIRGCRLPLSANSRP